MEPKNRSSHRALWLVGGLLAVLLGGCMFSFVAGMVLLFNSTDESGSVTVRSSASRDSLLRVAAAPTPRPLMLVSPPEGGVDYETAVLMNIYEQVNPSVVNVTVLGRGESLSLNDFLPDNMDPDDLIPFSSASGFVWDMEGHIVTNYHVVEGADQVQVTFSDGTGAIADVLSVDLDSDLAVLRIDPDGYNLVPVRLGDMDEVRVGMRVAAIGNPFGLEGTLTTGIVSAIGRSIPSRENFNIPDSIQTDAAINPGNSGGPLLNERGEVIGVNAQIRSEVRANSGVGFAVPIAIVERVVPALIGNGDYAHSYLGVSGGTYSPICADELGLPKDLRGALVLEVLPGTPAAKAGLRSGSEPLNSVYPVICPEQTGNDLITAIDDRTITSFDELLVYLERYTSPGDTVTLTVLRENEVIAVDATLARRPRR